MKRKVRCALLIWVKAVLFGNQHNVHWPCLNCCSSRPPQVVVKEGGRSTMKMIAGEWRQSQEKQIVECCSNDLLLTGLQMIACVPAQPTGGRGLLPRQERDCSGAGMHHVGVNRSEANRWVGGDMTVRKGQKLKPQTWKLHLTTIANVASTVPFAGHHRKEVNPKAAAKRSQRKEDLQRRNMRGCSNTQQRNIHFLAGRAMFVWTSWLTKIDVNVNWNKELKGEVGIMDRWKETALGQMMDCWSIAPPIKQETDANNNGDWRGGRQPGCWRMTQEGPVSQASQKAETSDLWSQTLMSWLLWNSLVAAAMQLTRSQAIMMIKKIEGDFQNIRMILKRDGDKIYKNIGLRLQCGSDHHRV